MDSTSRMYSTSMYSTSKVFLIVVLALALRTAGFAQALTGTPFSADMTMKASANGPGVSGKVYFDAPKWRMDMNSQGHQAMMIFDATNKIGYMVMTEQKMYMEVHVDRPGRGPQMPKAKPMDPENPCGNDANMECKKAGTETINGRATDKWEFTSKDGQGENYTAWVDRKLHFPIKTQESNGSSMELSNIQEGKQAGTLFEIPAGFTKFDMSSVPGMPRRQ